jgi:hypothetical protein
VVDNFEPMLKKVEATSTNHTDLETMVKEIEAISTNLTDLKPVEATSKNHTDLETMLKEVEAAPERPTLFSILNLVLLFLNEKRKEEYSIFSSSNSSFFSHNQYNANILRGEVDIFEGFPKTNSNASDLSNCSFEFLMHPFFSSLLDSLFRIFSLPYI